MDVQVGCGKLIECITVYRFSEMEAEDSVTMMHAGSRYDPIIPECSNLVNVASSH